MKGLLTLITFTFCFHSYAQNLNYIERMRLVEKFGHEKNIKLHAISSAELAKIMRIAGGINATANQAGFIQSRISQLDSHIQYLYSNKLKATKASIQAHVSGCTR